MAEVAHTALGEQRERTHLLAFWPRYRTTLQATWVSELILTLMRRRYPHIAVCYSIKIRCFDLANANPYSSI